MRAVAAALLVAACGGAGGGPAEIDAAPPALILPDVIDLPYVVAGAGASQTTIVVTPGVDPATITWALSGDPSITMDPTVATTTQVVLHFAGAPVETIASADLAVTTAGDGVTRHVPVFAVAGDPALGDGAWEPVTVAGAAAGEGITVAMPTAPSDVRVFVPESYRDLGAHELVLHFHGFNTTLAATLAGHRYQEHVYASGANQILIVPQGPVNMASGNFGPLMMPSGTNALLREALVLLYREQRLTHPVLADVVLTSHSGGYQAVAANLDAAAPFLVAQVDLFDSLYGDTPAYLAYATGGGLLRSDYTSGGGTLGNNQSFAAMLQTNGVTVADTATQAHLRDTPAVIFFSDSTHEGSTGIDGAYGEELRFGAHHSRRGPRIELRQAIAQGGMADVRWLAPHDDELVGFDVETSRDGGVTWSVSASVGPTESRAMFPWTGGGRVRLLPRVTGVAPADALRSDTARMDDGAHVLIVDGFDRLVDGEYGGLAHDFAAVVGDAVSGGVATISHRAIVEDGFDLAPWPTVIWLLGDESTADHTFDPAEQAAAQAFVDGGGALIVSGSEVAWDLDAQGHGAAFLAALGASYAADDSGSHVIAGASLGAPVSFDSTAGPYVAHYPDALAPTAGAQVVFTYDNGMAAAVGVAGHAVVVGFPLELVDHATDLAAVVAALVTFTGG